MACSGLHTGAQAQTFQEGVNYAVIEPPVSTQAAEGKVEVAEVFWYGCPHCYNLECSIGTYLKQKPDYGIYAHTRHDQSELGFHGKVFYVGRMLDPDGSKDVHTKIFEAIHKQRRRIGNDDQLQRFFEGLGFKTADINNAMKSMELQTELAYARDIAEKYGWIRYRPLLSMANT
ncbi:MAG: hypothetical protein R3E89_04240 [Thiolinea sp.]